MLRRKGFTLVELLVVIGIIALLMSILVPTLGKARGAANRAKCLSNQRQMAAYMYMYQTQNRGYFPPNLWGMEVHVATYCFHPNWNDGPNGEYVTTRFAAEGFVGPGYLVRARLVKDGSVFYCPEMSFPIWQYENWLPFWNQFYNNEPLTNALHFGYLYRIFYSTGSIGSWVTRAELDRLNKLRLGKFKGTMALIGDHLFHNPSGGSVRIYWPHKSPYGRCVAFSDGHGEFVQMRKQDYDVMYQLAQNASQGDMEAYHHFMWWAIDKNDIAYFTDRVAAKDWTSLNKRYPRY